MSNNTQILRQFISKNTVGLKEKPRMIPVKSYFDEFVASVFNHNRFELFAYLGRDGFYLYLRDEYFLVPDDSSVDWYMMKIEEKTDLNFSHILVDKSSFKYPDDVLDLFGFYSAGNLFRGGLNSQYDKNKKSSQIIKGINICVDTYEPYELLCAKHLYSSALVESVGLDVLSVIMSLWCESELVCDMVISL